MIIQEYPCGEEGRVNSCWPEGGGGGIRSQSPPVKRQTPVKTLHTFPCATYVVGNKTWGKFFMSPCKTVDLKLNCLSAFTSMLK